MAIAEMAIFIIGAEILLLKSLAVISRFAIKYSKFNVSVILVLLIIRFSQSHKPKLRFKKQKCIATKNNYVFLSPYKGSFFFISSTILYAAGQMATFFKVRSAI